jgi:hypothetical protein
MNEFVNENLVFLVSVCGVFFCLGLLLVYKGIRQLHEERR